MIKGFIWISLAVSLIVQRVKWIRILNSIWWLSSCVLVSAINIEILFKNHAIEAIEIVQWLVHFLLLYCAFKNIGYLGNNSAQEGLSEPLLGKKNETNQTGFGHANFISKLIFCWVNSLLSLGYSKPLDLKDVPSLDSDDEANMAYQKFVHAWESLVRERTKNNTNSLVLWSIVRIYFKENLLIVFYALIRTFSVVVSPLILYAFVNYSNITEKDLREGLSIVGILIVTKVFESLSQRHWFFNSRRSGMKMRSALMVAVYRKQLRLSSSARTRHSAGEIVNYIAVDAYRMGEFPWWFHRTWTSALQLILSAFGTVRDNILFGKPTDRTRYEKAIKACALDKDISDFRHGDLTEIGQRGINMSGGQKQRIQLARAVYNDADIYLLDDPFSAVDAHTAAILFSDCVMTALREKTVILVTHQVEFLSDVDSILVMEGGKVIQSGSYENLLTAGTAFDLLIASTFWLAIAIEIPKITNTTLIGVYALVSFSSSGLVYVRSYLTALLGLKASTAFFSSFTTAIFNASMLFFDSTPVGRILTRASSDLSILDFDIPCSITFVASIAIEILVIICVMVSVTWQVLIVAVPAMVASIFIQQYYQATATQLIRINGTTKAPIMNFAAETSLGVVTVRAFNMVDRFFKNYLKLVDTDASLFFHSNETMEWVVLRIEALQNLTVITLALLLILLPQRYASPGLVGLSLSYAFTLTGNQINWTRWFSNLSNYIISVERIKQFIHIPAEPPAIVDNNRPPSSWPSKGKIDLQGLEIRYRPNAPLVLKGITCTFKEGSRVGVVVGRTGSGKSTLISALFRLVEPSRGDILIDGMNICSMGLKDLRMRLSIIPQEPTLFKGSIRTNLDPLGLYSDDEIWKAVEKCQLKETISKLPSLLDSAVSDEGGNWSLGQCQLFCLGILVLDEATASIDSATDAILQRVIRKEFAECTVITVAHRVPTVIDSDMVMVLSYGKLVEFDEPSKLMDTNSSFSKLVADYWSSCRKNSLTNISSQQR
ncbi:hypothetical protein P8452_73749 [Trifolium repens]|nr:hypothetical protein P8452_73749 [Trifolium repens]